MSVPQHQNSNGSWQLDKRVPVALILSIVLQSAGLFMWVGALTSRVSELETKAVRSIDAGERVISLEAEMREVRRVLERIEAKLDRRSSKASLGPRA
ncbi:MAG: hypothetical protein AAF967_13665 [Pseudomonadota bacterium]